MASGIRGLPPVRGQRSVARFLEELGTAMKISVTAAVAAGLGLLAAACNPQAGAPAKTQEQTPVADRPSDPVPDAFANAVNFACEGGGKVDAVFEMGSAPSAMVRIDGGTPIKLAIDETATSGMSYKDANVSIDFQGDELLLDSGGTKKSCKFVSRELPPPKVEGVVRDLKADDAGKSIDMKVGEKVSISLSGVPTAGYLWAADTAPAFVKVSDGPGGATSSAQFLPGFAGGNHWEVLIVEATAPGEGELALVQKRPWEEKADPSDQRLKFKLTVK